MTKYICNKCGREFEIPDEFVKDYQPPLCPFCIGTGILTEDRYDCPIHGLQDGPDCPRC